MPVEGHFYREPHSIAAAMADEHVRLDAILRDVCRMVAEGELERADYVFGDFFEGLLAHIAAEEVMLFPLFETATGRLRGPTEAMRCEHDEIRVALAKMRRALDQLDAKSFAAAQNELARMLPSHNRKEEGILYPMLDRALGSAERAQVLDRLRLA
jgi:hemerythrin-like domain-containing protein